VAQMSSRYVSFGALFDPLSASKLDPGKYLRSPSTVDEKCITGGVNVGSRWGSKFDAYSQSALIWLDRKHRWARTRSRVYRLEGAAP
jgi:hypothetical protein